MNHEIQVACYIGLPVKLLQCIILVWWAWIDLTNTHLQQQLSLQSYAIHHGTLHYLPFGIQWYIGQQVQYIGFISCACKKWLLTRLNHTWVEWKCISFTNSMVGFICSKWWCVFKPAVQFQCFGGRSCQNTIMRFSSVISPDITSQ